MMIIQCHHILLEEELQRIKGKRRKDTTKKRNRLMKFVKVEMRSIYICVCIQVYI